MRPILISTVAAVMQMATFTTPNPHAAGLLVGYLLERGNAHVAFAPANFYANASGAAYVRPKAPGARDTVWFAITADPNNLLGWRNGGQALRLWYLTERDTTGDLAAWRIGTDPYAVRDTIGPSNLMAIAAACPDTNFTDAGRSWARPDAGGAVRFHRTLEDSALTEGPIFHQEAWQDRNRAVLCTTFGYYCVAGQRALCSALLQVGVAR